MTEKTKVVRSSFETNPAYFTRVLKGKSMDSPELVAGGTSYSEGYAAMFGQHNSGLLPEASYFLIQSDKVLAVYECGRRFEVIPEPCCCEDGTRYSWPGGVYPCWNCGLTKDVPPAIVAMEIDPAQAA